MPVLVAAALLVGNVAVCAGGSGVGTQEMACCKAGHRTCGQMTSASDCCKSRQQTAPTVAVAKQPDMAVSIGLPAAVPTLFAFVLSPSVPLSSAAALKRPHDPPHLHTYTLLI